MTKLCFRTAFAEKARLGVRRKYISKRTSKLNKEPLPPVLVIDLDYIQFLLEKRKKNKASNLSKCTLSELSLFNLWLESLLKTSLPDGIIFISSEKTSFCSKLPYDILYVNIKNYIFSLRSLYLFSNPLVIVSNNLELWLLSSTSANISFMALNTYNKCLYYNNKTGLEILSKFIGTYKIINKLGLNNIRYLNLQYLFVLIYYLKFLYGLNKDFYLDNQYFKNINKEKKFLRSNGFGLEIVSEAHKMLSYAFLTKPEYLDFFLLCDGNEYDLQLTRLVKLMPFDIDVLLKFKSKYDAFVRPKLITVTVPNVSVVLPKKLKYFTMIWTGTNTCKNYSETTELMCLARKYSKLYGNVPDSLVKSFPKHYHKDFSSIPHEKQTDNSIEDYVESLLKGLN